MLDSLLAKAKPLSCDAADVIEEPIRRLEVIRLAAIDVDSQRDLLPRESS